MPGDGPERSVEQLLVTARRATGVLRWSTFGARQRVMASGIMRLLKSLIGGRALNIIKSMPEAEASNGFEAWRRIFAEYQPNVSGRAVSLVEAVLESRPKGDQSFGDWYRDWLELLRRAEDARQKPIDDDMKCVVVRRAAPKELSDHLTLNADVIADSFPAMHDTIIAWSIAKKDWKFGTLKSSSHSSEQKPEPMQIGAMDYKGGKNWWKKGGKG